MRLDGEADESTTVIFRGGFANTTATGCHPIFGCVANSTPGMCRRRWTATARAGMVNTRKPPTNRETTMFRTATLRTAIAVLATASTVAAITPAANASKPIPGRFPKSSEGQRLKQQQDKCQNLKLTFDNWGTLIDNDLRTGHSADAEQDLTSQTQTYDYAKSMGCAWAV